MMGIEGPGFHREMMAGRIPTITGFLRGLTRRPYPLLFWFREKHHVIRGQSQIESKWG